MLSIVLCQIMSKQYELKVDFSQNIFLKKKYFQIFGNKINLAVTENFTHHQGQVRYGIHSFEANLTGLGHVDKYFFRALN